MSQQLSPLPIRKMTSCSDNSVRSEHSTISSVSFQSVQIREYERIAGDHPDVTDHLKGPPLSIGWRHGEIVSIPIDSYESIRQQQRGSSSSSSSSFGVVQQHLEPIKGEMRKNILQYGFNVTQDEIEETMKEVKRIKEQRERTLKGGNNIIKRVFGIRR